MNESIHVDLDLAFVSYHIDVSAGSLASTDALDIFFDLLIFLGFLSRRKAGAPPFYFLLFL